MSIIGPKSSLSPRLTAISRSLGYRWQILCYRNSAVDIFNQHNNDASESNHLVWIHRCIHRKTTESLLMELVVLVAFGLKHTII